MEVSGVVSRQVPSFSGVGIHTHSSKPSFSGVPVASRTHRNSGVSFSPNKFTAPMNSAFSDNGHLQYYVGPRCGVKEEKKDKILGGVTTKKKLKLLKGLSKNLPSSFSELGFPLDLQEGLATEVENKLISEASEVLLKQLELIRAEEKELKRMRKQEKAKLKAKRMKNILDRESSSSSESSDSECGEVIDMNRQISEAHTQPTVNDLQLLTQEVATLPLPSLLTTIEDGSLRNYKEEWSARTSTSCGTSSIGHIDGSSTVRGASTKRIEVCMGNKCKKSGSAALLEEFGRLMGVEGAAVGCKCMGKCRDGPNVRVLNSVDATQVQEGVDDSIRAVCVSNPLCIGVGLEDVGSIVANLCGEERKDFSLVTA
ncbi:hypothetical protein FNV43_RR01081 [Rhamnella rubrinervis]|uniref:Diacylglycerol O-acyltransferase 3, cytosolic n=1 Tax=Rhamnella rubrinervis TaxID=2594499 RepID=A0A8K0HPR8_9ROSA|nr:hypothetical protein FNV43_RR01081 [Rhamnella rubrinervis]